MNSLTQQNELQYQINQIEENIQHVNILIKIKNLLYKNLYTYNVFTHINLIARTSPTTQRQQRGKKFTGAILPEIYPKYSPADRFLNKSHLIQVKQRPSNLLTGSVYDKLSKAIWEKFEQNQLTQSTYCHKMYLWRYLFFFIKVKYWLFINVIFL